MKDNLIKNLDDIPEIPVHELRDGQIAIITYWSGLDYKGNIVQRYGSSENAVVIQLGKDSGNTWTNLFSPGKENYNLKVKVLPKGIIFTIKNHQ